MGFETVGIKDKSYSDCLRLEFKEEWGDPKYPQYMGTVW